MEKIPDNQLFLKLYLRARSSGLFACIPATSWQLLCVLASFMDRQGYCHPSQRTLARSLGLSARTVSRQLRELERFRFRGVPMIAVQRDPRRIRGGHRTSCYHILPSACLSIFTASPETKTPPTYPQPSHRSPS